MLSLTLVLSIVFVPVSFQSKPTGLPPAQTLTTATALSGELTRTTTVIISLVSTTFTLTSSSTVPFVVFSGTATASRNATELETTATSRVLPTYYWAWPALAGILLIFVGIMAVLVRKLRSHESLSG